ncbi:MAG: hypothetical protein PHZ00_03200, partial [Candidatus Peribacteraceae bacterium]|nr:hypothetical protein [Candidatus Peribacteraceae bacterium]
RKHKLRKQGEALSDDHMKGKLQGVVLRGEQLLDFLEGIPLARWSPERAEELQQAIEAIQSGLERFKKRAASHAKNRKLPTHDGSQEQ